MFVIKAYFNNSVKNFYIFTYTCGNICRKFIYKADWSSMAVVCGTVSQWIWQ